MIDRAFKVSAFALIFFCVSLTADARLQGNRIRGKVRNSSGVNLSGATVELQTGNGMPVSQTVTNNEGDFYFGGLTGTSYILIVSAPDYIPVSQHVEFVNRANEDNPGESHTIEVSLAPISGNRASRPRATFIQPVPKPAQEALDRAIRLSREGKSQDAIAAMQEATRLYPDYFDAHFALGNEFMRIDRLNEAIAELEAARKINPKNDRVYRSFGLVLTKQRKYAVAAAVFAEAFR